MSIEIVELSSCKIADDNDIVRDITRIPEHRDETFLQKYDFKSIFFDVYEIDGAVELNGPPLLNLKTMLGRNPFTINGQALPSVSYKTFWKVQRTTMPVEKHPQLIDIDCRLGQFKLKVQKNYRKALSDSRVLFSLSKNNDLEWIKSWAKFYVDAHGIDAIVFYDNGSDRYKLEDVGEVLDTIEGLKQVYLVSWPFPYGPRGGVGIKWDSDFTQYCMIEHARRRFFQDAKSVTYADIDELVVCEDGMPLFDHLAASPKSAITYEGVWIESIRIKQDAPKNFWNYMYNDKRRAPCTRKWTIDPKRLSETAQIRVHGFGEGFEAEFISTIRHRHFKALNFDWKNNRTPEVSFVDGVHTPDRTWVKIASAFFRSEALADGIDLDDVVREP